MSLSNSVDMYNIDHSPDISPDGSRTAYSAYKYIGGDPDHDNFTRYFEI